MIPETGNPQVANSVCSGKPARYACAESTVLVISLFVESYLLRDGNHSPGIVVRASALGEGNQKSIHGLIIPITLTMVAGPIIAGKLHRKRCEIAFILLKMEFWEVRC